MGAAGWFVTTLGWVERHNGLAQAVGAILAAAVAIAALIGARRDARKRTRPAFVAYLRKDVSGIKLVVTNIGGSPARDVDLAYVDQSPILRRSRIRRGAAREGRSGLPLWVHGLSEVSRYTARTSEKTLVISYRGYGRTMFQERFVLDLASLNMSISPSAGDVFREHFQQRRLLPIRFEITEEDLEWIGEATLIDRSLV